MNVYSQLLNKSRRWPIRKSIEAREFLFIFALTTAWQMPPLAVPLRPITERTLALGFGHSFLELGSILAMKLTYGQRILRMGYQIRWRSPSGYGSIAIPGAAS